MANAGADRLFKVREALNLFNDACRRLYTAGPVVCIDETISRSKTRYGSGHVRQPEKSAKEGFKYYNAATPEGLILKVTPYAGAKERTDEDGLTTVEIVMDLLKDMVHAGRILVVDRFYCTVPLAKILLDHGTYLIGTCRPNTKDLPQGVPKTLPRGQFVQWTGTPIKPAVIAGAGTAEEKAEPREAVPEPRGARAAVNTSVVDPDGPTLLFTAWEDRHLVTMLSSCGKSAAPMEKGAHADDETYRQKWRG